jgi:hypothetical protein
MNKYRFRIRTRSGLVVDNLHILGRDQTEAERKLRQVYHDCLVLDCQLTGGMLGGAVDEGKSAQLSFDEIAKQLEG